MKNNYWLILLLGLSVVISCKNQRNPKISDEGIWKLGWRMIENSMYENFEIAELQFDSLLHISDKIDRKFLIKGLEVKSKLNKGEEITKVLNNQDEETLSVLCKKSFLSNIKSCIGLSEKKVLNEDLQLKIIDLYVKDQAIRGTIMSDIISKYEIDTTGIKTKYDWSNPDEVNVDELISNQLKKIFNEYGFPTGELIGRDAMSGVFFIIQHSNELDWQRANFPKIKSAVSNGYLDGEKYALLYDRIQKNSGLKQKYGTQLEQIDETTYRLYDLEKEFELDKRRMEIGLFPFSMYKRIYKKELGINIVE